MRQFGELEAVIMDRLWEWGRPALVREMVDDLRRDRPLAEAAAATTVLASAATDAAQRIHRLLRPAEPLGRSRRLLLRAMAAGLVLGPLIMALAPAVLALALGRVSHP